MGSLVERPCVGICKLDIDFVCRGCTRTIDEVCTQGNALLLESGWTQVPDAPVDQSAWAEYRQALRNVPQQTGFPTDINWPSKPE